MNPRAKPAARPQTVLAKIPPGSKFSTVPLLFILQAVFMIVVTRAAGKDGHVTSTEEWHIYGLIIILAAWGLFSAMLAYCNTYQSNIILKLMPSLWIPLIPMIITFVYFGISDELRAALAGVVDTTHVKWFVGIQGLRVLAIGTVIKAITGNFPRLFGLLIGGLDTLYGVSAWILFSVLNDRWIARDRLIAWHVIGVVIIVPAAQIIPQLSLPGFLHRKPSRPPMNVLWAFPMALAPSLVVPIFVLLNVLCIWRFSEYL